MNLKQMLGLDPEHTFYESFTAYAVAADIRPDGEVFVNLCDDPGKTISMIELKRLPQLPSRRIYRHISATELLDVVRSYALNDQTLTLEYQPWAARVLRARGCQVYIAHPDVDLQKLEQVLRVLFSKG